MKRYTFSLLPLFFFLVLLFPSTTFSSSSADGKFDPAEMILSHIYDSHEWHLFSYNGHHYSIPLPVILFHEGRGLEFFMSSKLHSKQNNAEGFTGYKLGEEGKMTYFDNGKKNELETNKIWDFSITKNITSLFFSIILILFIFLSISKRYKNNPNSPPRGIQAFLEPIIIFVRDDIAKSAIGEGSYKKYLPFLLTIFFFIIINNLLGLIPIFPGGANLTGNIAVPMVMAAFVFIITTLSGTKYYWKHIFVMPGVPKPVLLILTPIEIIGVFLKPLVLMIRLFANITAGHIIILSFFSLIFIFGEMHWIAGYGVSVVSVLFVLFMMTLELLVAFLQAYVFTLLTAMYFGMAIEQH